MKRSQKIHARARKYAVTGSLFLAASVVVGCWTPMTLLSAEAPSGGWVFLAVVMGVITLLSFTFGLNLLLEARRESRLSRMEKQWEHARSVRPRL